MMYKATLARGKTYTLGTRTFLNGVPQEVDKATKEHLDANAKDMVTVEGRSEERKKFKFELAAVEKESEPKPVRSRRRKPDETGTAPDDVVEDASEDA